MLDIFATHVSLNSVWILPPCRPIIIIIIITFKVTRVNRQTATAVEDTDATPQGLSAHAAITAVTLVKQLQ